MSGIYSKLREIEEGYIRAALCTIIHTTGSTPGKTGAKMIVYAHQGIYGTIGGGNLEMKVIEQAKEVIATLKPAVYKHKLLSELAMCCGGTVDIFIEPILNKKKLYIFGAGHIGKSLARFAHDLDFQVTLIDSRYEAFQDIQNVGWRNLQLMHQNAIQDLTFDAETFVVIVTYNHAFDREILALTAPKAHAYLGMIGSMRKVEIAKKNLLAASIVTEQELKDIDMPMGVEINAVAPAEIAISILAALIDKRNTLSGFSGGKGRSKKNIIQNEEYK